MEAVSVSSPAILDPALRDAVQQWPNSVADEDLARQILHGDEAALEDGVQRFLARFEEWKREWSARDWADMALQVRQKGSFPLGDIFELLPSRPPYPPPPARRMLGAWVLLDEFWKKFPGLRPFDKAALELIEARAGEHDVRLGWGWSGQLDLAPKPWSWLKLFRRPARR